MVASLPSASTFAKSKDSHAKTWRNSTKATHHIKAHRTTSDIPVVLLDTVLSDLYDDIVGKKYFALTLMERLSRGFDEEANMVDFLIRDWARHYGTVCNSFSCCLLTLLKVGLLQNTEILMLIG